MRSKSKLFIVLTLIVLLVSSVPMGTMVHDTEAVSEGNDSYGVAYDHLDVYKQQLYVTFYNAMEQVKANGLQKDMQVKMSENVDIYKTDIEVVRYAYMSDHPENFWASYFTPYPNDGEKAQGQISLRELAKDKMDLMTNSIVSEVGKYSVSGNSLVDKVMSVHEYIRNKATYDENADDAGNIYGTLVNGKAKCDGYSLAFNYVCKVKSISVESVVEIGDIKGRDNSGHAWNVVRMDNGNWYYLDITWDDTIDTRYRYEYFLIGYGTSTVSGSIDETRNIYYDYHIEVSKDKYPYEAYSFWEKNAAVIAVLVILVVLAVAFVFFYRNKKKKAMMRQAEVAAGVSSGGFCPQCGNPIPPDQDFCSACGKKVRGKEDGKQ